MTTLEDAILLATQAHRGQKDKVGQPYILHPLRVMLRVEGEAARTVAVLHDVVEDTPHSLEDLRAMGFGDDVVAAVDSLTRRPDETYEQFVERAATNPLARRVKLADLEDNMDIRRYPDLTERDCERLGRYVRAWHRVKAME